MGGVEHRESERKPRARPAVVQREVPRGAHACRIGREDQDSEHAARQEADGAWAMCEPNERGAVQMRLMQVPPQQLRTPHVTLAHLERAMLATRPSVGPEDLHRFEEFTRLYGAGN